MKDLTYGLEIEQPQEGYRFVIRCQNCENVNTIRSTWCLPPWCIVCFEGCTDLHSPRMASDYGSAGALVRGEFPKEGYSHQDQTATLCKTLNTKFEVAEVPDFEKKKDW